MDCDQNRRKRVIEQRATQTNISTLTYILVIAVEKGILGLYTQS